jgi:AcrR family transcriptional regulator
VPPAPGILFVDARPDLVTELLTEERILDTTEDVLRRFGPAKATVVDVARALGVSHGSVYRHFPSKAALRDAVAQRWLARLSAPLTQIAEAKGSAADRLRRLVRQLSATKRRMAQTDPEMFATYDQIVSRSPMVVSEHLAHLAGLITTIIEDGVAEGEFIASDPRVTARAVLHATARFHHPAHASEWTDPNIEADLDAVLSVLLEGLLCSD